MSECHSVSIGSCTDRSPGVPLEIGTQQPLGPEQVVEVAFDGIQTSSRYPGGMALRFARVKGYRQDKSAADADTIEAVRAIYDS